MKRPDIAGLMEKLAYPALKLLNITGDKGLQAII